MFRPQEEPRVRRCHDDALAECIGPKNHGCGVVMVMLSLAQTRAAAFNEAQRMASRAQVIHLALFRMG